MIGAVLGNRYELVDKIGEGGMAIVYKARCRLLNRYVAVKVLKPEFQEDTEFLRRFSTEAQAAASLSDANVVSVYDVGTQGKLNYIVMEYIEGITLKEYMSKKEESLSISEAVDFSLQIASALEHAHAKKIIHRDIKPQNVAITNNGVLKVMDFGLAHAVTSATTVVGNSEALGSVHYASPEQVRGGFTDERSDIYSLGIVMYEMFTGQLPFDADTPVAVAMKHLQKAAMPPRARNENIPVDIENIILKAMNKEARERYENITDLIADLKEAIKPSAHTKSESTDKFSTRRLPAIPKEEEAEELTPDADNRENKKKEDKVAIIAAIATSVVIVSILGFILAKVFLMGNGPDTANAVAPNLVGQSYNAVVTKYQDVFVITEEERVRDDNYAEGEIISQYPEYGDKVAEDKTISVVVSLGSKIVELDDFTGMDKRLAINEIERFEVKLAYEVVEENSDTVDIGMVIRQAPPAKSAVKVGDTVTLYVSKGKSVMEVKMPKITGETVEKAKSILEANDLTYGSITYEQSDKPKGTVISQSVAADNMVSTTMAIDFVVSTGQETNAGKASKKIALKLPQDRDSVYVQIISTDGTVLYSETLSTSRENITVEVKGQGRQELDVFYDSVLNKTVTVNFSS